MLSHHFGLSEAKVASHLVCFGVDGVSLFQRVQKRVYHVDEAIHGPIHVWGLGSAICILWKLHAIKNFDPLCYIVKNQLNSLKKYGKFFYVGSLYCEFLKLFFILIINYKF